MIRCVPLLLLLASTDALAAADVRGAFRRLGEAQATDKAGPASLVGTASLAAGGVEAAVVLELGTPGCRYRVTGPGGESSASFSGGKVAETGTPMPELAALTALSCPFLALRGLPSADAEAQAGKIASQQGINLAVVALSRADRKVAVVVGAKPGERERPQLWIDKESGRVLRVSGRVAGQLWEARFLDAGSLATGRRAPRAIELWRAGERRLVVRLMTAQAEPPHQAPATSDDSIDDPD
jgi:hypothetical protein